MIMANYVNRNDFLFFVEGKLRLWIRERQKLTDNIKPGGHKLVAQVSAADGIVFNLGYFEGPFLNKYYYGEPFNDNADKLVKQIAAIVKQSAIELKQDDFIIAISILLLPKSFKRVLKFEKGTLFLAV
jgi:hypothetical protein